jgi:hypothetical protein
MQQTVVLDGSRLVRSVGQLVAIAAGAETSDTKVSTTDAAQALRLCGMAYHRESAMLRIAVTHDGTARLLRHTHWDRNWAVTLKRVPGAEADGTTRQRFAGAPQRFVAVPVFAAIGEE